MNETLILNEIPLGGEHATMMRWLVEPRATVEAGQPVAILLGERAEFALAADRAGTIASLDVAEGATTSLGETLATLAGAMALPAPNRITPVARRIAREHAIEARELVGSGPGGRILKRDVLARIRGQGSGVGGQEEIGRDGEEETRRQEDKKTRRQEDKTTRRQEDKKTRRQDDKRPTTGHGQLAIVHRPSNMVNYTAPTLLTMMEADFGAVQAACQRLSVGRVRVDERACVALAVAEALREHPLQAQWHEAGLIVRKRIVLQVEQNNTHRIVSDAQDLNVRGIARALATATSPQAATFRIRMLASGDWAQADFVPTLTVGAIAKRPVVVGEGSNEQVAIRAVARLTLHYDARVATPAEADRFLRAVIRGIERFAPE